MPILSSNAFGQMFQIMQFGVYSYMQKTQFILDLSKKRGINAMKSVKSFKLVTSHLKTDSDHLRKQGTNITCHAQPAEYGNKQDVIAMKEFSTK